MSEITANLADIMDGFRKSHSGTAVLFNGDTYYARVESVTGAKAGVNGLPASVKTTFQQFEASLDPVVVNFSPQDFRSDARPDLPLAPMEGDTLTINQMLYQVTAFTFDDAGGSGEGDTLSLPVFALRFIYG